MCYKEKQEEKGLLVIKSTSINLNAYLYGNMGEMDGKDVENQGLLVRRGDCIYKVNEEVYNVCKEIYLFEQHGKGLQKMVIENAKNKIWELFRTVYVPEDANLWMELVVAEEKAAIEAGFADRNDARLVKYIQIKDDDLKQKVERYECLVNEYTKSIQDRMVQNLLLFQLKMYKAYNQEICRLKSLVSSGASANSRKIFI